MHSQHLHLNTNKFQRDGEKDTWISDLLPVSILQLNHCWYLLSDHSKNLAVKRHWGYTEEGQGTPPKELRYRGEAHMQTLSDCSPQRSNFDILSKEQACENKTGHLLSLKRHQRGLPQVDPS